MRPLFRGMQAEPLGIPGARTLLKKALCLTHPFAWPCDKHRWFDKLINNSDWSSFDFFLWIILLIIQCLFVYIPKYRILVLNKYIKLSFFSVYYPHRWYSWVIPRALSKKYTLVILTPTGCVRWWLVGSCEDKVKEKRLILNINGMVLYIYIYIYIYKYIVMK